jgi:hypothetical protein
MCVWLYGLRNTDRVALKYAVNAEFIPNGVQPILDTAAYGMVAPSATASDLATGTAQAVVASGNDRVRGPTNEVAEHHNTNVAKTDQVVETAAKKDFVDNAIDTVGKILGGSPLDAIGSFLGGFLLPNALKQLDARHMLVPPLAQAIRYRRPLSPEEEKSPSVTSSASSSCATPSRPKAVARELPLPTPLAPENMEDFPQTRR